MPENLINKDIKDIKKALLDDGFRIVEEEDKDYFSFEKNNKYGYFEKNEYRTGIASRHHYSTTSGEVTFCVDSTDSAVGQITIEDFNKALNFTKEGSKGVVFFSDFQEFLINNYFLFQSKVLTKDGSKPALDYLEGYYIYKGVGHAPVIDSNHTYLWNNFYERAKPEVKKAIFQIENGELKTINHNFNLFEEGGLMQAFKNELLGQKPDIDAAAQKLYAAAGMKSNTALKEAKEFVESVKNRSNAEVTILNRVIEINNDINSKMDEAVEENISDAPKM